MVSGVGPGSSTAMGASLSTIPRGRSYRRNKEQSREMGKEQLVYWWGKEPQVMLGSQHGQAGKPHATCSPHKMTSATVFSFFPAVIPLGPWRGMNHFVPRSHRPGSQPSTGLEYHQVQTAKDSDPVFPQAFLAERQECLFTFSGENVDQCDCLL